MCIYVCIHVGANNGLRSSNKSINKEAFWEETNKRCPLNAMTKTQLHVWPNATVPYIMDASISKLTKDCSTWVGGRWWTLKFIKLIKSCVMHILHTCSMTMHANLCRIAFQSWCNFNKKKYSKYTRIGVSRIYMYMYQEVRYYFLVKDGAGEALRNTKQRSSKTLQTTSLR